MVIQRGSIISLATLVICLCVGSLIILPIFNITNLAVLVISQDVFENHDLFEQGEFEEEYFLLRNTSVTIAGLASSKPSAKNLGDQLVRVESVSPPPKPI